MPRTVVTAAPDAPPARRVLPGVRTILLYAAALVAVWFVWPTSLGGCTTLTYVNGHSMEPTYHTGDIVVSRCGEPQVGDVIVYAPASEGGARIIHRVIGGDADGWVVRGDNNSFTDPFEPAGDEVLGVAQLHVPKVGLALRFVTNTYVWLGVLFLALALWAWPPRDDEVDEPDDASGEPLDEPDEDDEDDEDAAGDDESDDERDRTARPDAALAGV
ncbi:signal peptidase I [Cellulomonas palmilytica]|uniref:signal peptidase I n=1 Tax=Cellulomonas palmilytica TaxID=2608402 RepID=UPI001F264017|nr:signal peptidase I [Cellulomonas palmilytica]UJP40953.1 signal peptidase I [Cellulomonas palmilytica]